MTTFNALAFKTLYEMSRQSGIEGFAHYLDGDADAIRAIRSATYDALETLPDGRISPTAEVELNLPDDLQQDAATLFTLALRKQTVFHGNGACFALTNTQIEKMLALLEQNNNATSLDSSEKKSLTELFQKIIDDSPNSLSKDCVTKIGIDGGAESPDFSCDQKTMSTLFHTWGKLVRHVKSDNDFAKVLALSPENKQHILSQGVFGGVLKDPSKTGEWDVIAEGLTTREERLNAAYFIIGEKQAS
jgi:hypothetical protein